MNNFYASVTQGFMFHTSVYEHRPMKLDSGKDQINCAQEWIEPTQFPTETHEFTKQKNRFARSSCMFGPERALSENLEFYTPSVEGVLTADSGTCSLLSRTVRGLNGTGTKRNWVVPALRAWKVGE